MIKITKL